jgi:PAS domain S-box-containing protein
LQDILRLEKTKQDLLDRLEQLSSLLDNLPGMAFRCIYDESLTFEYVSRGAVDMLGYDPSDIEGELAFRQMVHQDDQLDNKKILSKISKENSRYQMVYRMRAAWGEFKWIFEQGTAVFSEDGRLIAIEGLLTDITDQKTEEIKLREENLRLRTSMKERFRLGDIIGKSQVMQNVYERILKAAQSKAGVIITGESGTGKELVARAIHDMSPRHDKPFIAVNCGAIPEHLLESEFFGHRKGSFSGAHKDRLGLLAAADKGTLFLDEIGEMSAHFQVKLLRALDGKGFTPVGDNWTRFSDFRLIAATNKDLRELVRSGWMREDFYYRINAVPIELPPLRDRKEDISLLIDHLAARHGEGGQGIDLPADVRLSLLNYDWPGNVRELQNVLNRYFALKELDMDRRLKPATPPAIPAAQPEAEAESEGAGVGQTMAKVEKSLLLTVLEKNRWHVGKTAEALGISRRTLQRRIKKHALK